MKTNYFTPLIIAAILLLSVSVKAQAPYLNQISKTANFSKDSRLEKKVGFINLKSLKAHFENHKNTKKYTPTCTVDVLNGEGIYLFSISDISTIPTIRVGVDVKVGLTITL